MDDKTAFELCFQGTTRALADAGIDRSEVDGFMSLNGSLPPVELTEYLGLRPNWVDSTGHGGSVWEFMLEHAAAAIAQGLVEVVVLTYGSTQRADLKKGLRMANLSFGTRGPLQFAAPFGHPVGSHYAMVARRHMHEFGTTIEQLAEVAVSTRFNAGLNPDAYYRDPHHHRGRRRLRHDLGPADQAALLHPLRRRRLDRADHEERARDCAKAPVWVLGTGEAVSHTTMSEWEDFTESPCVRSGALAFERAGRDPRRHRRRASSTTPSPRWCSSPSRGWASAPRARAAPFVEDGKLRVGGALPTNTDGGGLSSCQPGHARHVPPR